MLLLIDDPKKNCALIEFINSMKKSGIYLVMKSTLLYQIRLSLAPNEHEKWGCRMRIRDLFSKISRLI